MIFVDWNMGWGASIQDAIFGLKQLIDSAPFIITLQEINRMKSKALVEAFNDIANMAYSLDYRPRGRRESGSRELGIMILTSNDIEILDTNVIDSCLLPERTLYLQVKVDQKELRIMSFHSITGCDHKKAKSLQFYAFADAIDKYRPDIVSFDANEPQIDAPSLAEMVFFDNRDKGRGAREFFQSMADNGLSDAYLSVYKGEYEKGKPLAVSHRINKKNAVRYDFIYVNQSLINVKSFDYKMKEAESATGDHALLVMEYNLG